MIDQMGQLTTGTREAILDVCLFRHIFMAKYIIFNIFLTIRIIIMETLDLMNRAIFLSGNACVSATAKLGDKVGGLEDCETQSWINVGVTPLCPQKHPKIPQDTPRSHHKPKTKLVLSMMMTKMMDMIIVTTMMAMANEKR